MSSRKGHQAWTDRSEAVVLGGSKQVNFWSVLLGGPEVALGVLRKVQSRIGRPLEPEEVPAILLVLGDDE